MMPNYEARLEIHHDCPYCILTERYSGLRINSWDNARTHVAVVNATGQITSNSSRKSLRI
jgi:predicted DNA binding protein